MKAGAVTCVIGLLAAAAGCAPPASRPLGVDAGDDARYAAALTGRTAVARALEADVLLWCRIDGHRLPGVQGRVLLAGPDAVRLRVHGVFGAALDGALRGDSLTIHLAARRQGVEVGGLCDSIGVIDPGALLVRALSAGWERGRNGGVETRGMTGRGAADRSEVDIGPGGLPRRVTWRSSDGRAFEIRYERWTRVQGVAWPIQWRLSGNQGAIDVQCRVDRVRALASLDPARLRVVFPPDVERIAAASLAAEWRATP